MSRVTAAFVCALCDPDNPRPASIMCSNNCGRYVCAVHAMPRKGPGSAMVCLACAEALDLIEKPKARVESTPLVSIPPQPEIKPEPSISTTLAAQAERPTPPPMRIEESAPVPVVEPKVEAAPIEPPAPKVETKPAFEMPAPKVEVKPVVEAPKPRPELAPTETSPLFKVVDQPRSNVVPSSAQSDTARRLVEPPPPPQSSETIVSQRGNTLQVPKVTATLGKPPQPIGAKPRVAQRASSGPSLPVDWPILAGAAGSIVLGIIGFVMILAALAG